jgi:hypothetical protein
MTLARFALQGPPPIVLLHSYSHAIVDSSSLIHIPPSSAKDRNYTQILGRFIAHRLTQFYSTALLSLNLCLSIRGDCSLKQQFHLQRNILNATNSPFLFAQPYSTTRTQTIVTQWSMSCGNSLSLWNHSSISHTSFFCSHRFLNWLFMVLPLYKLSHTFSIQMTQLLSHYSM